MNDYRMSTMTEATDTERRARLRGREAMAHWRMRAGLWVTRAFATLCAVNAVLVLLFPAGRERWYAAAMLLLWAAMLDMAAEYMARGSRVAACLLLAIFAAGDVSSLTSHTSRSLVSLAFSIGVLVALAAAAWSTFELASIHRSWRALDPDKRFPRFRESAV